MAGIGFALRRLSRRDDLSGIVQGFAHSSLASSGPWLITILALAAISLVSEGFLLHTDLSVFRLIVIYNFSFSLVFSGPFVALLTRCLADQIYEKDVTMAPATLLGALLLIFLTQLPVGLYYYFFYVALEPLARLASFANLYLISAIWLISVFLTALKDFRSVSGSFIVGMSVAVISAFLLAPAFGSTGLILGFDLGLAVLAYSLLARVFCEYPYPVEKPFVFLQQLARYWEIALGGLVYNLAIWVDKWVMWFGPEAEVLPSKMFSYPNYDSGMFAAYLTIVPALAFFVYSIETSFFEKYLGFYRTIQHHGTLREIESKHQVMIQDLLASARNFIVLQLSISVTAVLVAPRLFESLNISYAQLGIFRLGVLGSLFHILFLCLSIILSYFDLRRVNLALQLLFLISNFSFTVATLYLGFPFYGYGYFLATLLVFGAAFVAAAYYIEDLPYQTFVRGNSLARR